MHVSNSASYIQQITIEAALVAVAVATGVALVVAASTSAVAFGTYNPAWDGASDLRALADDAGADGDVALNTTAYDRAPANRTVAVVLSPDRAYTATESARVRQFVRRGGTLVVAEDFGAHGNALLAAVGAGARFDGSLLRDERYHYRAPALPRARNVSNSSLTDGVDRLTLNYGTAVRPNGARVLATTSGYAYLDTNRNGALDERETLGTYPVATVERIGAGRVIAVGDPSLFINAMLDRPGNRAFATAVFAAHDRVLLDYSHVEGVPPLAHGLLVVRRTPLLQAGLVLGGLVLVGAWGRGLLAPLRRRLDPGRSRSASTGVDDDALVAYLRDRYPAWDEPRLRRIIRSRTTDRGDRGDESERF